jgi:Skp family chaperone for outer membrane proteins
MRPFLLALVAFLFFAGSLAAAEPAASPASAPDNSVLIVDVKRVLDESRAAINAQKKIEVQRSAFQQEISAKEKSIREAEQELLQLRGKLKAEEYAGREDKLRVRFREVEKYVMERRQILEKATTQSLGKVREVLLIIVQDVAKARGARAVLVKQQVLWADNNLDITDEVLKRLNTELPELPVDIKPEGSEAKPAPK